MREELKDLPSHSFLTKSHKNVFLHNYQPSCSDYSNELENSCKTQVTMAKFPAPPGWGKLVTVV